MITKTEIIGQLVEACPSFEREWNEHCKYYEEELLYVALGDFARHLLQRFQQDQVDNFPAIARVIERLLVEGDHSVREAASIGLLEGIQNVWANSAVDPELITAYLLPESRRWWDELNAFWRGERRYVGEGLQQ
jgi:hypothetical protein